ncbi:MAG TPA: type II toxin-antitoxin system VapC family toxin [Mesorhizobium sp.]
MPSAVDTNILVRLLIDDGSEHVAPSRQVFADGPVFVPTTVILETEWVLRSQFGQSREQVCEAFDRVLGVRSISVENADRVASAVDAHRVGLDFADALHLFASGDCDQLFTFDGPFVRRARRAEATIPVNRPRPITNPKKSKFS